jgi:sialate O-acetylesterase
MGNLKKIPVFKSEDEEREFWANHDSSEFVNWKKSKRNLFPNLKPSTKTISLRLPLLLVVAFLMVSAAASKAEVTLPRIFGSNMVLQQGIEIPVWGWANPGERVTVTLSKSTASVRTGRDGKWKVQLPRFEYGGPYTMTITGRNRIIFDNVMIGEVWIASGQSNMEWPLAQSNQAEEEIAAASYPDIRLFQVPRAVAQLPEEDIASGEWKACTPGNVANFSAVAYFFGRELHQKLNVPVGLIQSAWGGTVAETWISPETIENDPDFAEPLKKLRSMDMESYEQEQRDRLKQMFGGKLPTEDKGIIDGEPVWSAIDLDDGDWKSLVVPKYWEEQGYAQIDGVAWYRKEIKLTEEQSQSNVTLHLGKVDDSDITWVNGIEVGKTEGPHDEDRIYTIDAKHLRPGKNMLVVRVNDTGGNGGIWGDPKNQFLAIGSEKVDISGDWKFRISKATLAAVNIGPNSYPTLLFNGMINPVVPYAIKGAIWYQGEGNASRAKQYQRVFPALINDWRQHWNQGDFPFLFVSLANFMKPAETPGESSWAELREAQTKTLSLPQTGMAVTIDIGEAGDIHPRNKQDVGLRLSLNALKIAYDKDLVFSGPIYQSVEFKGDKAIVTFDHAGSGLIAKDRYGYLKGFTIAGADNKFHWAQARITGENQVEVYAEEVKQPVAVRYGWANNPDDVNLYNAEGLPANPFRSRE